MAAGSAAVRLGFAGFALARYMPDGSPDPSFGEGGFVATNLHPPASYAFIEAIALQADGKIVVAGVSDGLESENVDNQFTLARYNANGSLDTSFGTHGITNTVIPQQPHGFWFAGANSLAILADGDIVAAGSARWSDGGDTNLSSFALVRYTPDGSPDPTFGDGGIVQTTFRSAVGGSDYLAGIAVQPDGKIVAAGGDFGPGHGNDWGSIAVARYEPDGSLDPSFGSDGKAITAEKIVYGGGPPLLLHGKIYVPGTREDGATWISGLARYEANGRLDPTFGTHGFAAIKRLTGEPRVVLPQNDGKILIAFGAAVARLRPDGRLDASFGRRGVTSFHDAIAALALQPDGKLLLADGYGDTWRLDRLIGGNNCFVPRLHGTPLFKANKALSRAYCNRGLVSYRFSSEVTRGRIIAARPRGGTRLSGGAKINLIVSRGKPA